MARMGQYRDEDLVSTKEKEYDFGMKVRSE